MGVETALWKRKLNLGQSYNSTNNLQNSKINMICDPKLCGFEGIFCTSDISKIVKLMMSINKKLKRVVLSIKVNKTAF